ncbi:MAG: 3' terminal RNA ribose 2'-O-methyltransferase Hen1 [Myxococcota bacterium]
MLLTVTTEKTLDDRSALELGWLLAKHPARLQSFALSFGTAWVCYPEACDERTTAALVLDLDTVGLARPKEGDHPLAPYVSDRPYVASSFLAVAIAQVLGSALRGSCRDRPELPGLTRDYRVQLPVVPVRGAPELVQALFGPLGYRVTATRLALDERFPEWGESRYFALDLAYRGLLSDLLSHLYVLLPVLDGDKHYWVGEAEIEKLVAHGEGWLAAHPQKEAIVGRYLKRRGALVRGALARLGDGSDPRAEPFVEATAEDEAPLEAPLSLDEERRVAVREVLVEARARRLLDLGCGEGKLVKELADLELDALAGCDVSAVALARAEARLEPLPRLRRERITLFQGSLVYRDKRFAGWDAITLVEVIEHVDPSRLSALEDVVFAAARPALVVVTTPNAEYNVRFASLPAGRLRHRDHRFEWTRAELAAWCDGVAARHGYRYRLEPVGPCDPDLGAPTQMAVLTR